MSALERVGWALRQRLGPSARQRVRRGVDRVAGRRFGSVAGALTDQAVIALTFDDGPDPHVTPRVLDALDDMQVTATFFVLSDFVRATPHLVEQIAARGHEVALHGDNHERLTTIAKEQLLPRLGDAKDIVEQAAGTTLTWFRPPFGAQDRAVHRAVRQLGMETVVWGPTAFDWVEGTPREVADRGLVNIGPGAVLLLHDGLVVPPGAVPPTFDRAQAHRLLLESLVHKGYSAASVSELLRVAPTRWTVWYRP